MKKLGIILVALSLNVTLNAQQLSMYSQYYWNDFVINPAFTGIRNTPRVQLNYRNQWAGFKGSPKTYNLGGHTSLKKLNMGIGGMLFSDDQGGAIKQAGFQLNYSYNLRFNESSGLSLGLSGIINQYSYDGSAMSNAQPDAVLQSSVRQVVPDFNFGAVYHYKNKLFIGLSSNQLIQTKIKKFNSLNLASQNQLIRHYYLTASYNANLNDKLALEPYVLTRTTFRTVPQFEVGSKLTYDNFLMGGLSYRNKESVVALMGVNYKQFLFVYSYDILISNLRKYSGGSHELLLAYQFVQKAKPEKVKVPEIKDRDADGITDKEDVCPDEKGTLLTKGCPDRDNDTIRDTEDACPDIAGLVKFKGCPDTDGDGIVDSEDACPQMKGLVSLKGCPDSDGDGLSDQIDECPNLSGPTENKGCPFGDSDNDGVLDKDDACPSVAGAKEFLGCPDSDNDGIKDSEDLCPNQKGLKEFGGCPDSDGDGLEDSKDACPNEKGLLNGCPDKDGDGLSDKEDACPEISGPIENKGCPVKKKRNIDELMKMKLVCATGKPDITEQSKLVVKEIAQVLKEEPTWTITIEGHTDNVGDANANLMLSKKRSESVRNLLISYGIDASRIKAGYFGELQPIADNATPEGRNKNRRIDFKFVMD
jgi:type IX secretion system PorP/SprF family membrane protein